MRKEVRHPITKNANSISLIRIEEEENEENNKQINNSAMEPGKSGEEEPLEGINTKNEAKRRTDDEPAKSAKENVTKNEEDKLAGVFGSHAVRYEYAVSSLMDTTSNQIRGRIYWPKFNVPTTLLPPEHHPQVGRPSKQRKKSVAEMEVLKIIKNGKLSRKHKTVTYDKCKTKGHNSRSCTGPRVLMSNKRKVLSKGMDLDTDAPTGSQSKKRATTEAASSVTQTNKGKAPATNDGPQKKRASRKKLIGLG
ncbi:hypothetical protein Tco_0047110 [Tanacetum coccineum]